MMQIATGVAFLMTSLYGAGHENAELAAVANSLNDTPEFVRTLKETKDIEAYLKNKFKNDPILVDIARCESTFRHYDDEGKVLRGKVDNADTGVMQINQRYHGKTAEKMGIDLYDIDGNTNFAIYLYKKYGTAPWASSKACWAAPAQIAEK